MAYGIKYFGQFDSFKQDVSMTFEVQILQKDYEGESTEILLSGSPAIQEWQDDERNVPVKGSTLRVGIINNGIVSIESFYSNYDDEFQVILRQRSTDAILFIGYLIQDECAEIMADFEHEIVLKATDMLGTLKDTSLSDAAYNYPNIKSYTGVNMYSYYDSIYGYKIGIQLPEPYIDSANKTLTISNSYLGLDGTYTILNFELIQLSDPYYYLFTVAEYVPDLFEHTGDVSYYRGIDIMSYLSIGEILRLCILSTKLSLSIKVISTIYDIDGETMRLMDSSQLLGSSFLKDGNWNNCYDVAESILSRFRATLLQSKGYWWIIRYNELFIGNMSPTPSNYLYGYQYSNNFEYESEISTTEPSYLFNYNDLEFGTIKSVERPVGYIKDTFQYVQSESLITNSNLNELGNFVGESSYGTGVDEIHFYDYVAPYWEKYGFDFGAAHLLYYNHLELRIRIKKDYLFNEIERYLTLYKPDFADAWEAIGQSPSVQLSKNDVFTISFKYKAEIGSSTQSISIVNHLKIVIQDGISNYATMDDDGVFYSSQRYIDAIVLPGVDFGQWQDFSITSKPVPFNCIMNLYLFITYFGTKTCFKDISITVNNSNLGANLLNGQQHSYYNTIDLNSTIQNDISIDTSPSPYIAGTLFVDNNTGLMKNISKLWSYPGGIYGGSMLLGKRILIEDLFIKNKARYKYEGNLLKIYKQFPDNYIIGPECVFIFNNNSTDSIRLIFGKLSIDYKQGMADCNMFFISNKDEDLMDIINEYLYEFRYLYENN